MCLYPYPHQYYLYLTGPQLRVARAKPLDIWKVRTRSISQTATQIMFNYFNIGFDAQVRATPTSFPSPLSILSILFAFHHITLPIPLIFVCARASTLTGEQVQLGFHEKRSESPELFKARLINKWVYAWYGLENVIRGTLDLSSVLKLRVDDKALRRLLSITCDHCDRLAPSAVPVCLSLFFRFLSLSHLRANTFCRECSSHNCLLTAPQNIIIPNEVRTLIFLNFTCYQNGVDIWGPPTESVLPLHSATAPASVLVLDLYLYP